MSTTEAPSGTAPGCHVTVARLSVVATAPAWPATALSEPTTAGGTGALATSPDAGVVAVCEPPAPVAVTTSDTVVPMSPGVSVYVASVAPVIAAHVTPVTSQRRHWYANDVGDPVHVPTEDESCWPAVVVPAMLGAVVATGRVAEPLPDVPTAIVGADAVAAPPDVLCAVTVTISACPVSSVVSLYESFVAPVIGVHPPPAASQRCHWYVNATGLPPLHVPGTAVRMTPVFTVPTIVGGMLAAGAPDGYGGIAIGPGSGPAYRSPSTQLRKPGTAAQSVHCQNVQPRPPQFPAGTLGDPPFVQCATHKWYPPSANDDVSPSRFFQKFGDAYTNALTPVRAFTSSSHAVAHCASAFGPSPPVASRSSTGGSSPGCGCATVTK